MSESTKVELKDTLNLPQTTLAMRAMQQSASLKSKNSGMKTKFMKNQLQIKIKQTNSFFMTVRRT